MGADPLTGQCDLLANVLYVPMCQLSTCFACQHPSMLSMSIWWHASMLGCHSASIPMCQALSHAL